ncbi:hypothetical protein Tco_0137778 [Tanacetum coccineum]
MALPPRDQIHQYLRFEGLEYKDADITDFEERLGRIYGREIHRVQVFDFGGLTDLMAEGLSGRMLMEHRDAQGQSVFTSRAWRRLFEIRGPLVHELILEFFRGVRHRMSWREFILGMGLYTAEEIKSVGFGAYWAESGRLILDKGDLSAYWVGISSMRNFLGIAPSYTLIRDPMLRYLRILVSRRKCEVMISRGQFVAHLLEHFRLLTEERLQGLTVIVPDLPMIDMVELVAAAGAPEVAEGAPDVDEGDQAILEPVQVPQPPPIAGPARTMAQMLGRLEKDVHGL